MLSLLNKLRGWAGVDRPVFYSGLGQAWSLFSGPITIFLITRYFSAETQGYYYTFLSVAGITVFLEMGFSQCIVQFASHEFAHLRFLPGGVIEGDPAARSRLISLGRLSIKWYGVCALLAVVVLCIGGHWFFAPKGSMLWPGVTAALKIAATGQVSCEAISWAWPWWALCFAIGLSLLLLPISALLEGCNQMSFVYGLRTFCRIVSSVVLWAAVFGGGGLYTGALMTWVTVMVMAGAFLWRWRGLLGELHYAPQGPGISWREEIWPFQWRIAVSWISGYFIFSLFTPVLFKFHGPDIAGQMGATLQLINSLNALASAWTLSKGPRFGILINQRQYPELDRLFFKATTQSVGICIAGGIALLVGLVFVKAHFAMGARFLDPYSTSFLVLATISQQVISGQAIYLRAHKQEPFMWASLANGISAGLVVTALSYYSTVRSVCIGFFLVQIFFLVWASLIWKRCRKEWHLPYNMPSGLSSAQKGKPTDDFPNGALD